jgi:hypothetical protein
MCYCYDITALPKFEMILRSNKINTTDDQLLGDLARKHTKTHRKPAAMHSNPHLYHYQSSKAGE